MWYLVEEWDDSDKPFIRDKFITKNPEKYKDRKSCITFYVVSIIKIK
jgi:hypothetical protein